MFFLNILHLLLSGALEKGGELKMLDTGWYVKPVLLLLLNEP